MDTETVRGPVPQRHSLTPLQQQKQQDITNNVSKSRYLITVSPALMHTTKQLRRNVSVIHNRLSENAFLSHKQKANVVSRSGQSKLKRP
jgi:hypothetical protein